MGMATVYGIVDQHKGWIEIDSREGAGTTVSVYLPASSKTASDREKSRRREDVRGSETILVVEDEQNLRHSLVRSLNTQGYRVLEAENGPEALKIWREQSAEIDLLFTDMVMPEGMTGWSWRKSCEAKDLISRLSSPAATTPKWSDMARRPRPVCPTWPSRSQPRSLEKPCGTAWMVSRCESRRGAPGPRLCEPQRLW
jgi:hypothetical protein